MSKLKMPQKGQSAAMLAELQAEHAAETVAPTPEAANVTTLQPKLSRPVAPTEAPTATQEPAPPTSPSTQEDRFALAMERAASDSIAVVTIRVPASLNRYVDDYVARLNKIDPTRKYRKQDAIMEAFSSFYADHPMPPAPPDEELT